jgi:hypothetical protein
MKYRIIQPLFVTTVAIHNMQVALHLGEKQRKHNAPDFQNLRL